MNWRKSTSRAKWKATSQEERLQKWKENFKNLLENLPKITDKPTEKIINWQLDIKLGQFAEKELDAVQKKIKSSKSAGLTEMPPEVWKTKKFNNIFQLCNTVQKWNTREMNKSLYLPLLKKGDLLESLSTTED